VTAVWTGAFDGPQATMTRNRPAAKVRCLVRMVTPG
jgi:hypothetical protein